MSVAVFLALWIDRRPKNKGTVFTELAGAVKMRHLSGLFMMPMMATAVYATAAYMDLSEEFIRLILEFTPLAQGLAGAVFFLWAWVMTVRPFRSKLKTALRSQAR